MISLEERLNRLMGHRIFVVSSYVSLLLFVLPFLVYSFSRATGVLPSQDEWMALGASQGPWRWSPQGNILWLSPVLIPTFTYIAAIVIAVRSGSVQVFKRGAVLAVTQFAILIIPMFALFWTIR